MKVLLVRPAPPKYTIGLKNLMICEPLELEYVAAGIRREHEVEILDLILENDLPGKIRQFKPNIVGMSSYITGVNKVKEISRVAKAIDANILTVVGGVHATLVPEDFNNPNIDIIAMGDGVTIIKQLVERYLHDKNYEKIPGLAFPEGDALSFSPATTLNVDVENLPLPRRDLVEKYSQRYYYLFHQPVTIMKTIFGCPFTCNFCCCWTLTAGKMYMRTPESIVEELEMIKTEDVYIVDDIFFVDVNHSKKLQSLIVDRKIQKYYLTYSHSDFIVRHPDIIKDWAEIGLKASIIGLESPIEKELQNYEKKTTVECNTEAIHILRKNKVDVYGSFIVSPDWTEKEFSLLQEYIEKNGIYFIAIQPLTPLPATKIFSHYEKNLTVDRNQHELWDMQHSVLPTKLPLKKFYRKIRSIYLRTCLSPWKARSLQLRTAPPVWSKKYLRLLFGGMRVLHSLRKAYQHSQLLAKENSKKTFFKKTCLL